MLGNYAKESFKDGRGLLVRQNAVAAMATLCAILGLDPATTRLHKEDKATTHSCPGKNVIKQEIVDEIAALLLQRHGGEHG